MAKQARKPGKIERSLSLSVLLVLAVVAAGILRTQFDFNPAVRALRPDAVTNSKPAAQSTPAIFPLPAEWVPAGPLERFSPATLSDKIDGKAELYLSAGFLSLECQRVREGSDAGWWLELFVYDMGSFENAYAVFSSQRRDEGLPVAVTRHAYLAANGLYWVRDRYYVEALASEASERAAAALQAVVTLHVGERGEDPKQPAGQNLLPAVHRKPGSERLIPKDVFGFDRFDRVHTAEYLLDGTSLTVFVSVRTSPEEAKDLARSYQEFLLQFGGRRLDPPESIADALLVEIMDTIELVFARGRILAGVHAAPDIAAALELSGLLVRRLEEESNDGGP